jgi:outer membrane protein, multidrug efflux system
MELRMFKPTFTTMGVSVATSLLLAGCGTSLLAPSYQRPALAMPATLATGATNHTTASAANVDGLHWWKGFQDPVLDALLQEAATNSQDLVLASARIEEARATLDQTKSNLFPTVDLNASASRKRGSENASTYNASAGTYSNDRQLDLSASYEIDFWGKYSQSDAAARARLLAQSANRGTVLITLYANVAQSYFSLRALDEQTQLAEQTFATRQENLRLQKLRFEGGVVGELDLRQAESEASSVQATLQLAQQNRRNAEAALAVLLGRSPADIMHPVVARGATVHALYKAQVVPANVQSDVLFRRPDVVSAEQALIAANADIGIARAAYFPRLSLTISVGQQSNDMSTLMDPASMFWNLLGNLTQPIFRAGAIDAVVAASNARQKQALAQYTQTVQNALRDVHDALNNVAAGQDVTTTTAQRIDALRSTLKLATLRYNNGYSSYLEELNAQRNLHQAEAALIDTQRTQLNALVGLYKALGGGWNTQSL